MSQHLTGMKIDKVSLVDRGANGRSFAVLKRDEPPPALADLWKAADEADPVVARRSVVEKLTGWLGIGGEPVAKAQTFASIIAGEQLTDALYDSWWTLESALWSAIWAVDANGSDLSIEAKQALVAQNLDEFKAWLLGQMAEATVIAKRDVAGPVRGLEALLRKAAGDDQERGAALTKAAEPLLAALGDVGSGDPEDTTKRALPEEDAMDPAELAKALQPMIEAAVDAAVEKRLAAQPASAADIAKTGAEEPEDGITNADLAKALVLLSDRIEKLEGGRSVQQSMGGQAAEPVAKRNPLAGILG